MVNGQEKWWDSSHQKVKKIGMSLGAILPQEKETNIFLALIIGTLSHYLFYSFHQLGK